MTSKFEVGEKVTFLESVYVGEPLSPGGVGEVYDVTQINPGEYVYDVVVTTEHESYKDVPWTFYEDELDKVE